MYNAYSQCIGNLERGQWEVIELKGILEGDVVVECGACLKFEVVRRDE